MQKNEILTLLQEKKIPYEIVEHPAVFTIEEAKALHLPHEEAIAKNLFLRDDKKRQYYLLTVQEDKHVDLKQFQEEHGTRRLSFASEEDLMALLGLAKGSVTPFGLLNDTQHKVLFYLDDAFQGNLLGIHPNENTAMVWLQANDLMKLLKDTGSKCSYLSMNI